MTPGRRTGAAARAETGFAETAVAGRSTISLPAAGRWPETNAAAKVAALAERLGPEGEKRIRRFLELHAWLVLEAESAMMEKAAGDLSIDKDQVKAALAEQSGLRRALGRSTFTALKALLPFSRNDYWEVSELRQRIRRS